MSAAGRLVGLALARVPYVTEGPPHLLHDLHVFDCRCQRFCGCVHGIQCRVTGILGCGPCLLTGDPRRLPGFPETLPLLPDHLERFTMMVVNLPRFLCESSEPFRLIPGRLGFKEVLSDDLEDLCWILTAARSLLVHAVCLLPVVLRRDVIVRHLDSFLSIARPSANRRFNLAHSAILKRASGGLSYETVL